MRITKVSALSRQSHELDIPVDPAKYRDWLEGKFKGQLIQDIFPELSASHREFLMTGVTDEEWNAAFQEDEDGLEAEPNDDEIPGTGDNDAPL